MSNYSKVRAMEWKGRAVCPGSCGELVQGTWDGINFLVPCPVNLFSLAEVTLRLDAELRGPLDRPKALEAVRRTLELFGHSHLGGELVIHSRIPCGKGMASSTADIGAAAAAAAAALGVCLRPRDLVGLAIGIEPTDATLLPGLTLIDHVKGIWRLPLGRAPEANILVIDPGGQVDTLAFNAVPDLPAKNRANERFTKHAFQLVRRGIQEKNLGLLGQGATLSAEANQSILNKHLLPELKAWGQIRRAEGVIAAHSGTVLGIIYSPERDLDREEEDFNRVFPNAGECWKVRLIEGGVKVVKPDGGTRRKFARSQGTIWESGVPGF